MTGVHAVIAVVAHVSMMMSNKPRYLGTKRWKDVRMAVLSRDQRTCAYCGDENANTVDHVVPLAVGGDPYAMDNLVACCMRCNSAKGKRGVGVFLLKQSTPPVFVDNSLPSRQKPHKSPFIRP